MALTKALIDPRGGMFRDERTGLWVYQKKPVAGTPGDVITAEIAILLYDMLKIVEVDVMTTRCLRRSFTETGESGQPLFHEGSGQYLKHCRVRPSLSESPDSPHLPREVWGQGDTALDRDRLARSAFCSRAGSELMVCIDLTNYASDEGLEVGYNGAPGGRELAQKIVDEVSKRTRRRPKGVRGLLDEEQDLSALAANVIVVNCGSTWDPFTVNLLKNQWFRNYIALGVFSGIWKHYSKRKIG